MCTAVECSLKQQPVPGKGALEQNNGTLGKNSLRSVGGGEKETAGRGRELRGRGEMFSDHVVKRLQELM